MSDAGLGNLNIDTTGMRNNLDRIKKEATTPVPAKKHPEPASGARLEDPEFMNRTMDGGISTYDPSQAGFKLRLGGSVTNVPFVDLLDGASQFGDEEANPFNNPAVQDYNASAGASVEARINRERWSLGVKINGAAAVKTGGIEKNASDMGELYDRAKGLETSFSGLESQVNDLNSRLQNSTAIKRMNEIIGQIGNNPNNLTEENINELKSILGSGEIQKLLDDVNKTLGNFNSTMTDAGNAIALLGDGTRTILGDAAVRGAAEINGGFRTPRYNLGNGWGMRGGIEGAVIVPLPNHDAVKQGAKDNGLPEFKSMMAKVSTQVQVTTTGLNDLSGRLNAISGNLNQISGAVNSNKDAINKAGEIVNKIDPNDQSTVWSQMGDILKTAQDLEKAAGDIDTAGQDLNKNLEGLSKDLENVTVQTSMALTTVTPTAPFGAGIKDIGVSFDGPVGDRTKLRFSTGFLNPYGVLLGEKSNYNVVKKDDEYKLEHVSTQKMNVFHEFYDPAFYGTAGVTFNEGKWFRTDFDMRLEQSLTDSSVTRGSLVGKQALGPFSFRAGVMDTDLQNPGTNTMYMGGLGVGSIKNPDIVTVDAATNGFTADTATNAMVTTNLNIHF